MTSPPERIYTRKGFAPVAMERDVDALTVTGNWPPEIDGSLYRIGPNPQFEPINPYNPLLGDGMVHAFHIHARRVSYLNRWVRTEQWKLERKAGRALFATSGDPRQSDEAVAGMTTDGVANTNLVWHAGRLLALEEGHLPIELHPQTLETQGVWTFAGGLATSMCAHPRIDPATGDMVFFANFPNRRFDGEIAWYVANAAGAISGQGRFRAPFPALVHDFAVTRDFLVFPVCPVTVSMARARAGRPPVAWEPGRQSRVAVLNRHHPHEVRWFTCEPCFVWHVVNGWNDGDAITLDVCQQAEPAFPHEDGSPTEPSAQAQHLTRWELDWSCSHEVARRALCEDVCEYPRFDERFGTTRLGHSYFCCHGGPGTSDPFHRGIGHFDHAHERMETFRFGATCAVSEPVFVPRTPRAGEGDGFLLCIVYQEESDRSHLAVLDALHVDRGPIARAVLRHRVPMGFHGCWLQR